jgi:hypothetical protein
MDLLWVMLLVQTLVVALLLDGNGEHLMPLA